MSPKKQAEEAAKAAGGFENLSEEEVHFGWRSLAENGKIGTIKLRQFMWDVCGTKLSIVQAKDLLNYMDADGNGSVGREDFEFFMQTGRLSQTDSATFMWKPKSKFRAEHPQLGDERPTSPKVEEEAAPKVQASRRPQGYDPRTLDKIEKALEKYETETWARLMKEEEEFLKSLFKQFDQTKNGKGEVIQGKGEELDAMMYHQMLAKWFPLASWCSSGKFRAPDTLAVIKYLKEKKDGPAKKATEEKAEGGEKKEEAEIPTLSYDLWLDVVNGKYRPLPPS